MTGVFAAERRKLTSVRAFWWMLAGVAAYPLLSILMFIRAPEADRVVDADIAVQLIRGGADVAAFAALLLGIVAVAGEYRYGTIVPSLLAVPGRHRLITAKLVTMALAGGAVAGAVMIVSVVSGGLFLTAQGFDVFASPAGDLALTAVGVIAVGALFAVIGAGIGAVVRNQSVAIAGSLVWLFAVENALPILLHNPDLRDWTLTGASSRLYQVAAPVAGSPSAWQAVAVLVTAAAVLGLAGVIVADRREVGTS